MQIHDLNTKSLTDPAYVAFDDGTDTYKVEFNDTVESAAQSAVAEADLTQNTVGFTSGDSLSPSGWTSVSQITTDSTLATLFNRISTMVKNVRYIWNLLGSSLFSNVARTLTGAIGNTALTTTAQTLSGAIAEHESDISTLNSKTESSAVTYSRNTSYVSAVEGSMQRFGNVVAGTIIFTMSRTTSDNNISLITGLPAPRDAQQFMIMCVNDYSVVRAQLASNGTLRTWYGGTFVSGKSYMINLAYVAN